MNYYFISKKNKGLVLFSVVIITFLLLSFLILIQVLVNSRVEIYKTSLKKSKIISEKIFLEKVIEKELTLIEQEIEKRNIDYAYEFFSISNSNQIEKDDRKEIFKLDKYSDRVSYGGYRLDKDNENFNYRKFLEEMIEKAYIKNITINYYKDIKIQNKNIRIGAVISYTHDSSKNINNLTEPILKRIWIKDYEKQKN